MNKHHCELLKISELSLVAHKDKKYSLFFNNWITITPDHPMCKEYLISLSTLNNEKKYHQEKLWWIIHPFSKIRFYWEIIMILVYATAFITIPFSICFIIFDYDEIFYDYFNPFLYVFFWIDIFSTCITGFYDRQRDEFVLDQLKILKRYFKGFFLIDVLTSLPYDYLTSQWRIVPGEESLLIIEIIALLPLLKVSRYVTFKVYVKQFLLYFDIEGIGRQLLVTLIFYTYVIHWFTCFCNLTPLIMMYVQQEGVDKTKETWMLSVSKTDTGVSSRYQRALFIVLENLTSSGYGGIIPKSEAHILVCTILMFVGRCFECYIIIMLLQIVFDRNASESKYEETVNQLSAYSSQKQLPLYMKRRLRSYYHYRFRNSYFREKKILSTLSEELRQEVVLHSCRRLVENVEIFQDLPRSVLVQIVTHLKTELYLTKDMIIKAGTQGDCMFFLASGTVAILTPTGREVCFLQDGSHFGEVALLVQDQRRVASVVAVEVCEVYRLDRKEFRKCIAVHSDLFAKIEKLATERMHRTLIFEEQHKRFTHTRSSIMLPKKPELPDDS